MSTGALFTGITVDQDDWAFRVFPACVEVYDPDGHEQFQIPGSNHTAEFIEAVARIYAKGMRIGIEAGKSMKAAEVRNAIGAAAPK